jgi:hypothetical protein
MKTDAAPVSTPSVRLSIKELLMKLRPSRLVALAAMITAAISGRTIVAGAVADPNASFYDLKTRTLDGQPADLGQYRGKVALVVNVASKCGYTPQYAGLEKLHRELSSKGVAVLGFPSNDFGGQEPGTAAEIKSSAGPSTTSRSRCSRRWSRRPGRISRRSTPSSARAAAFPAGTSAST